MASFTLVHPARIRGQRAKFFVREDATGKMIFESYVRKEAEERQKELNAAAKEELLKAA